MTIRIVSAPESPAESLGDRPESLARQVKRAAIWRSGSQIVAQTVQWGSTFLVIRILTPADYGLFAMTQVILTLASIFNGMGLANAIVRAPRLDPRVVRQTFGILIAANAALALAHLILAPLVAAYYRQPVIAQILSVQALLYAATPLIALPQALLARGMEFSRQAKVNILASLAGAGVALGGALAGWGVWALVFAPIALFWTRGIGLTVAAGGLPRPSFDFRGAGAIARYGGLVAIGQLFVFVWTQADIAIAGRSLPAHDVGLYATSVFLVQIMVSKFVPPLNEVAFAAYARMQDDAGAVPRAFLKLLRLVMTVAMPFYLGIAASAAPLLETLLGQKWVGAAPLAATLALSMPFYTIFVLFAPACEALGRPGIATRNYATAAVVAPLMALATIRWGVAGLAASWLVTFPVLLVVGGRRALPVIGISVADIARVVATPILAAIVMGAAVAGLSRALPPLPAPLELAILVPVGAAIYGAWLLAFGRDTIRELVDLVKR